MSVRCLHPKRWLWFSPWMIIGSVCILAAILVILAVENIHREKEFMMKTLLSQANVLIDSLEASNRTGMMGMGWGQPQIQLLMEETAQQPDILYLTIVSSTGRVVADSQTDRVGKILPFVAPQPGQIIQRFVNEGRASFEVIRAYQPWRRQRGRAPWGMSCAFPRTASDSRDLYIMVGLDPSPFEAARRQDLQQTILLFGVMFLAGAAGLISLLWAHYYRSARCSLQEIRAFTSTLVGQMPVGLLTINRDGQIQRTNEAAQQILRSNELNGKIENFACFVPIVTRLQEQEAIVEEEIRYPVDGTESVHLLVNASAIRDGERQISGYAFLFTDISNIKQLEEQLRRSERQAALGKLAAGVAHEIRNPLSSIKGFAKILAGKFAEGEHGRKIAGVMEQEVERLNRVVTELLNFARPTELKKQTCSVNRLVEDTLRLVESDATHRGVKIEATVIPEGLKVEVDPHRFTQILLNLCLNALQAMEGDGVLKIEASCQEEEVVFKVIDSGAGIAPEHLAHIFDPYFTTKPHGVGLGLANVHKLVEAHGADIQVRSTVGEGTNFTIRLPAEEEKDRFLLKGPLRRSEDDTRSTVIDTHS